MIASRSSGATTSPGRVMAQSRLRANTTAGQALPSPASRRGLPKSAEAKSVAGSPASTRSRISARGPNCVATSAPVAAA